MTKKISFLFFCLSLLGCSSTPPEVNSNISLISHDEILKKNYPSIKQNQSNSYPVIKIEGNRVIVTQTYFSALGLICTKIEILSDQLQTFCLENEQWQAIPKLD